MKKIFFISLITITGLKGMSLKEQVNFWAKQMAEHAEFCSGFTQDQKLKKEGLELKQKFSSYSNNSNNDKNNTKFLDLSNQIKKYQGKIRSDLKKFNKNKDIKLKLELVDHMDKETAYAQKKAQGKKLTKEEEAKFWTEEHEGQANVMVELIKPKAQDLKDKAKEVAKALKNNKGFFYNSKLSVVEEENQELNNIAKELDHHPSDSTIPKKLAEHEKREREFAKDIFEQF